MLHCVLDRMDVLLASHIQYLDHLQLILVRPYEHWLRRLDWLINLFNLFSYLILNLLGWLLRLHLLLRWLLRLHLLLRLIICLPEFVSE